MRAPSSPWRDPAPRRATGQIVLLTAIAGLCLPTLGCKKSGHAPDAMAMEPGDRSVAEPADPLAELAVLEDRMRTLGLPVGVGGDQADGKDELAEDSGVARDKHEDSAAQPNEAEAAPSSEPISSARASGVSGAEIDQCATVCDLSEAICDLEVRICDLLEVHEGERIYADACSRASDDCDVAGDACDRCGRM